MRWLSALIAARASTVSFAQALVDFSNPTTELHQHYHNKGLEWTEENFDAVTSGALHTDKLLKNKKKQESVRKKARARWFRWPRLDSQDIHDVRFNKATSQRFTRHGDSVALGDPMEHVYVISLGRRPSKTRRVMDQLANFSLNAKIVTAMDGDAVLYQEDVSKLGFQLVPDYGWGFKGHNIAFTTGEAGCWMSHATIWHHMVENKIPAALILEDDFDMQEDFPRRLGEYLLEAEDEDWDMMYVGRSPIEKDIGRVSEHIKIPAYTLWTVGYIIKLQAAKRLVKTHAEKHVVPLDQFYSISMGKGKGGTYNERSGEWMRYIPKTINHPLAMEPPLVMPYVGAMFESDTAMLRKGTRYIKDLPLRAPARGALKRDRDGDHKGSSTKMGAKALEQITFKPGRVGILCDTDTGVIAQVHEGGQAADHGVKPGWKFLQIDGLRWTESLMEEKVNSRRVYIADFQVPVRISDEL